MRTLLFAVAALAAFAVVVPRADTAAEDTVTTGGVARSNAFAVPFVENRGQFAPEIRFHAPVPGGAAAVTADGRVDYRLGGIALSERFGDGPLTAQGGIPATATINYYRGSDPARWVEGAPAWTELTLGTPWNGISVTLTAHTGNIEKKFHVAPGGDPARIAVRLTGAERLAATPDGALSASVGDTTVGFTRPRAYQTINGHTVAVAADYTLRGDTYGFTVGRYDTTRPLVIDPLVASTLRGGTGDDEAVSMAILPDGSVAVAGMTYSDDLIDADNAFIGSDTRSDCFVMHLDAGLANVLNAVYIGGTNNDCRLSNPDDSYTNLTRTYGAAVAYYNNSYFLTGVTFSTDFPSTAGTYDTVCGTGSSGCATSSDTFVVKLSGTLTLQAGTFLGGGGSDTGRAIAVDGSGTVFVTGSTASTDHPKTDTSTYSGGNYDIFIGKFNNTLTTLLAGRYLGGSGLERPYAALFANGSLYLTGITASSNYPTTLGCYKSTIGMNGTENGIGDIFVTRLDAGTLAVAASTFFGGQYGEYGFALAADGSGDIVLGGATYNTSAQGFPVSNNSYMNTVTTYSGTTWYSQGYVAKFDAALTDLVACTYIGGPSAARDNVMAVAVNPEDGSVFAAGFTNAADFYISDNVNSFDPTRAGGYEAFVIRLDTTLADLIGFTFLGDTMDERAFAVGMDNAKKVVVAGFTNSPNFPTTDGTDSIGANDVFVTKIYRNLTANPVGAEIAIVPTTHDFGSVTVAQQSATLEVRLENHGDTPLMVTGFSISDQTNFTFDGSYGSRPCLTYGASIAENDYCTGGVTFSPQSAGDHSTNITISSNAINAASATYDGTGVAVVPDLDTVDVDTVVPDTVDLDTVVPDTIDNDTVIPDTPVDMDTVVPDTIDMDTAVADDTLPDDLLPDDDTATVDDLFADGDTPGTDDLPVDEDGPNTDALLADNDTQTGDDLLPADDDSVATDVPTLTDADTDSDKLHPLDGTRPPADACGCTLVF